MTHAERTRAARAAHRAAFYAWAYAVARNTHSAHLERRVVRLQRALAYLDSIAPKMKTTAP
jgi:DNA-directed RNA polymerase specialized sigma24 family protein